MECAQVILIWHALWCSCDFIPQRMILCWKIMMKHGARLPNHRFLNFNCFHIQIFRSFPLYTTSASKTLVTVGMHWCVADLKWTTSMENQEILWPSADCRHNIGIKHIFRPINYYLNDGDVMRYYEVTVTHLAMSMTNGVSFSSRSAWSFYEEREFDLSSNEFR